MKPAGADGAGDHRFHLHPSNDTVQMWVGNCDIDPLGSDVIIEKQARRKKMQVFIAV
jgi:hypothetical protein